MIGTGWQGCVTAAAAHGAARAGLYGLSKHPVALAFEGKGIGAEAQRMNTRNVTPINTCVQARCSRCTTAMGVCCGSKTLVPPPRPGLFSGSYLQIQRRVLRWVALGFIMSATSVYNLASAMGMRSRCWSHGVFDGYRPYFATRIRWHAPGKPSRQLYVPASCTLCQRAGLPRMSRTCTGSHAVRCGSWCCRWQRCTPTWTLWPAWTPTRASCPRCKLLMSRRTALVSMVYKYSPR